MKKKTKSKAEEKPVDFLDSFNQEKIEEPNEDLEKNESHMYTVKVTHPALRVRRAPNIQAEVVDVIQDQGCYTIINETNGWGQIDEDKWIMLSYTKII